MEHLVVPAGEGEWRQLELHEWHSAIEQVRLHDSVPDYIWSNFETARNLSLYSWFVYRFQSAAEMQALGSLEQALRERCRRAGGRVPVNLGPLLRHAIELRWITAERLTDFQDLQARRRNAMETRDQIGVVDSLSTWRVDSPAYLAQVGTRLSALRNEWAHGSEMLKGQSISTLRLCADLINQLFTESEPG